MAKDTDKAETFSINWTDGDAQAGVFFDPRDTSGMAMAVRDLLFYVEDLKSRKPAQG